MRLKPSNFIPPAILKGVPLPETPARVKQHHVNESVWNSFLRTLEPGDCFLIDYHQLGGVKMAAHRLHIPIVHRTERVGAAFKARVWRSLFVLCVLCVSALNSPAMPTNDEWNDAEMTADEAAGKPLYLTAAEGVAGMTRRIAILTQRFTDTQNETEARQLALEIAQAHARLAEYQTQLKGKN